MREQVLPVASRCSMAAQLSPSTLRLCVSTYRHMSCTVEQVAEILHDRVGRERESSRQTASASSIASRPSGVTLPFCTYSALVRMSSGNSSPRGILISKAFSRRNTMSRKSIDSAPRSPTKVACGVTSSSSTPSASTNGGLDLRKHFFLSSPWLIHLRDSPILADMCSFHSCRRVTRSRSSKSGPVRARAAESSSRSDPRLNPPSTRIT